MDSDPSLLSDADVQAWRDGMAAEMAAAVEREGRQLRIASWVAGGVVIAALTALFYVAGGESSKDCNEVAGAGGQTLNVCVDSNGNISDGDR